MATLWQLLTRKKTTTVVTTSTTTTSSAPATSKPEPYVAENQIYNPLHLRLGGGIKIKTIDLEDYDFRVSDIREITRRIDGNTFPQVDYNLVATKAATDGSDIKKRLWLIEEKDKDTDLSHSVVLLNFVAGFGYDKPYHDGLAFSENKGEAQEGDDHFWRVNDVQEPWTGTTKFVTSGGTTRGSLTYWDFWREFNNADGQKELEFYIVEMDGIVTKDSSGQVTDRSGNGYFEIWRGSRIEPSRIDAV